MEDDKGRIKLMQVSENTWRELSLLKYSLREKTMDDLLRRLINHLKRNKEQN